MAVDTLVETSQSTLTGVARVLVHAGKLSAKAAEELARAAKDRRSSFVSAVVSAGAVPPADLAHVLSSALYERFSSRGEADFADKLLSAMRYEFGGHIEKPSGS